MRISKSVSEEFAERFAARARLQSPKRLRVDNLERRRVVDAIVRWFRYSGVDEQEVSHLRGLLGRTRIFSLLPERIAPREWELVEPPVFLIAKTFALIRRSSQVEIKRKMRLFAYFVEIQSTPEEQGLLPLFPFFRCAFLSSASDRPTAGLSEMTRTEGGSREKSGSSPSFVVPSFSLRAK